MRTTKLILIALMALGTVCILGCGGDDDPTDPNPTPTPTTANIAGFYSGTETNTSLTPASHPIVQMLADVVGQTEPTTLAVQQNGSSITARLTYTLSGIWVDYSGTVGETTFSLNGVASSGAAITGIVCGDGISRDMYFHNANMTGTINGSRLSGTFSQIWNTTITSTGASAGTISLTGTFSVTKSK